MKDLLKFIKTSGVYFAGTVLTKLISFLLLPLYTSYIDPDGMGVYDASIAYVTFLCSVLYLDIWSAIMRFVYEYEGDEKKRPINSGIAIFGLSTIIYTAIIVGVNAVFHVEFIHYIFLYGFLMNTQTLLGYLARTQGKNVLYAAAGIFGSLMQIMANILLLVVLKMDYSALYISSCIGFGVNILIVSVGIKLPKLISFESFDRTLFNKMFWFSIPLCMNSVAYWFLSSYNRIAITNVLGSAANGMYAIASRFGSIITLFTSCFTMAWQEISYSNEAGGMEDRGAYYTKAINSYIKFLGMGLIVIIPAIYIIYPIMINDAYAQGKEMVPFYLLATIASAVSSFLGNVFTAIKKNNLLFYTTVVGSVVNVVFVHLLLPILGVQGASIALFLGFGINCAIRLAMLQKQMSFVMDWKFPGLLAVLFTIVFVAYNYGNMLINILVFLLAVLMMFITFKDVLMPLLMKVKRIKK